MFYKQSLETAHLIKTLFTKYFKPNVEVSCSETKIPFKYYCSLKMHLVTHQVMGTLMKINFFVTANRTPILWPTDQGVISTFKSYYLRNILCEALAAIDKSTDLSGQNKLRSHLERIHHSRGC